jgi:hypothetical protein
MKIRNELAKHLSVVIILLLTNHPAQVAADGFSVNGGGQQTGTVVGAGSGNDNVIASGTFAGTYNQNSGNGGARETVTINSDAVITPPSGSGVGNPWAQANSNPPYTNHFNGLVEIHQGTLDNSGTVNATFSSLPASTVLYGLDGYVNGGNPSQTNQSYDFGIGVLAWCGNENSYGSTTINNNSGATIRGIATGGSREYAMGIYAIESGGSGTDITINNYGTVDGEVTNCDGTAAGIVGYNSCYGSYGGMVITNYSGGICSATAPYYTSGIYANSYFGPVTVVNNGTATANSTGGQQGATANQAYGAAIDVFTYDSGSRSPIYCQNTGSATATTTGGTTQWCYGIFLWTEGGSMTFDNSGTVSATSTSASGAGVDAIYCGGNNGPVLVINSGMITGNAGPQGGWGLGVETDGSEPMTILNSGSISHNNGLGLAIFASYGTAVISNTGSIYGGLEGISAETFNGNITIYDTGSIQSGGNAIKLGTNNDTVYISGLPTITGAMDGGGGSNTLIFQLNGTLQYVNGTNATQGTNLSAYSLGTSGSILVSGKTYSWANFHVSGNTTAYMGSLPPQVTIPLANPGFETRGGGVAIGNTKLTGGFGPPGNTLDGWLDTGTSYSDSGVDYNGNNNFTAHNGSHAAFCKGGDPGGYQIAPGYQMQLEDTVTLTWWAKSTYQNAQQTVQLFGAVGTNSTYSSLTPLAGLTGTLGGNANNAAYSQYALIYVAGTNDVGKYVAVSFSNPNASGSGGQNWAAWDDFNLSVALSDFTVAPSPGIQHSGSNLQINWPYGTLLQATNIIGPWTTNTAAPPSCTITPVGPSMFFRIQLP